eukprot:SAG11_NODE_8083_length_1061_cov_3.391892_1_plen_68_part_01
MLEWDESVDMPGGTLPITARNAMAYVQVGAAPPPPTPPPVAAAPPPSAQAPGFSRTCCASAGLAAAQP